jgi:hypothetical protein
VRGFELALAGIFAAALSLSSGVPAAGSQSMVDAMTRMMDAFSDRWRWDSAPGGSSSNPWGWASQWQNPAQAMPWGSTPMSPWGASPSLPWGRNQGTPWGQWPPGGPYSPGHTADLTGAWVANTGAVMLFDRGLLRLYVSEDVSQDFEYRTSGNELLLRDNRSGEIRRYTFARLEDHMLLRDPNGNVLVLQRMQGLRR